MKAAKGTIGRAVEQPDAEIRFYLFHGPDEAQSRALANRLTEALGATRIALSAASLKGDPAMLLDQAGAMSLFGGKRVVWIEPATKDIEEAVAALLGASAIESPVIGLAGALPKASALLKLAENSPRALAHASYALEGRDAERMVIDLGRRFGLKVCPPVAARLADSGSNDQAIVAQELQKLSLYLDASPQTPKELDHSAIDAVGADNAEGDFQRLADLALAGDLDELAEGLARLPAGGSEAIPVIRSLQRRVLMLAPLLARVERGERANAVLASLFFRERPRVQRMLDKWSPEGLATVAERAGKLERSLMSTDVPDREALGEELLAIARKARSSR